MVELAERGTLETETQKRIEAHMKVLAKEVHEGKIQSIACAVVKWTGEVAFFDVTLKGPLTTIGLLDILKTQIAEKFIEALIAAQEEAAAIPEKN